MYSMQPSKTDRFSQFPLTGLQCNSSARRHCPPQTHLSELQKGLLDWFAEHKRPLPWRASYTPYEVWISEIMLQQTQMERGVQYFKRWMTRFPDVRSLAAASEDEVLRLWEGLGYYSRARHILAAARHIVQEHKGRFPSDLAAIRALPGVGPYTAGAIASIAFGEKLPCVDANVERVLARIFNIDTPVKQEPATSNIRETALKLVPEGQAREHNQAIMELGALVCARIPRCDRCPVSVYCISNYEGVTDKRPVPGKKTAVKPFVVATGVLLHRGRIFVQKRHIGGVWGNLWEFPGGKVNEGENAKTAVVREFLEETGFAVYTAQEYGNIRHSYTTYKITMHCFGVELKNPPCLTDSLPPPPLLTAACAWQWADPATIETLPLPAPHRKLAQQIFATSEQQCLN